MSEFKKLFNFENIDALRKDIDDNERDSSKGISKRVISLLKNDESWIATTKKLPDMLLESIDVSGAKAEMQNSSIKSLDTTIQEISKTSGGHIGKLQLEIYQRTFRFLKIFLYKSNLMLYTINIADVMELADVLDSKSKLIFFKISCVNIENSNV